MNLVSIGILGGIFLLLNILVIYFEKSSVQNRNKNYVQNHVIRTAPLYKQLGGAPETVTFEATIDYKGKTSALANEIQKLILGDSMLKNYLPAEIDGKFIDKLTKIIIADAVKIITGNKPMIDIYSTQISDFFMRVMNFLATRDLNEGTRLKNDLDVIINTPYYKDYLYKIAKDTKIYNLVTEILGRENRNLEILMNNITQNLSTAVNSSNVADKSEELNALLNSLYGTAPTPIIQPNTMDFPMPNQVETSPILTIDEPRRPNRQLNRGSRRLSGN